MDISADRTLRRNAPGALRSLRDTLLAQPNRCLFEVALALGERLLAVHYTGAGLFSQVFDEVRA